MTARAVLESGSGATCRLVDTTYHSMQVEAQQAMPLALAHQHLLRKSITAAAASPAANEPAQPNEMHTLVVAADDGVQELCQICFSVMRSCDDRPWSPRWTCSKLCQRVDYMCLHHQYSYRTKATAIATETVSSRLSCCRTTLMGSNLAVWYAALSTFLCSAAHQCVPQS